MNFDKAEFRKMDDLISKILNVPETLYLIAMGMNSLHGLNCAEAEAILYVSDSLSKDINELQEHLCEGARKGELCNNEQC